MRPAWNNWYHIEFHTYGQWLPGDNRSWRTRHHREHISGDYKNRQPLPRMDGLYGASRRSMAYPPVILLKEERRTIGEFLLESLNIQGVQAIALAVAIVHVHLLIRITSESPSKVESKIKQHATRSFGKLIKQKYPNGPDAPPINAAGLQESPWRAEPGRKLWALRGLEKPIADRPHQVRAFRYIVAHVKEGGWVWTHKTGPLSDKE